MRILKCIIADDEPFALEVLKDYINKTPFLKLEGSFKNAAEAHNSIMNEDIELAFLDIQMPGLSGMELAKIVKDHTNIVFTTAFDEYAIEGYKVNALGYLLKPFSYEEFLKVSQKLFEKPLSKERQAESDSDYIMIKADYKIWQIPLADIIYFEGVKDYVKIHRKSTDKVLMPLLSLKQLEERLKNKSFMRVQRSFIVNLDNIEIIEKSHIVYKNQRIKVSEKYKDEFQDFIAKRFY